MRYDIFQIPLIKTRFPPFIHQSFRDSIGIQTREQLTNITDIKKIIQKII